MGPRMQRIPPTFIKNLAAEISGTVTLTRSTGGQWHVRVWKNPNGTYLEDGWSRFMRENKLGDDEFLVFRYDGNMQFHVKIFGKNGVKRSAAMAEEKGVVRSVKRSRGRPRKYPICLPPAGNGENSKTDQKPESFTSNFPYFASSMTRSCVERSFLLVGGYIVYIIANQYTKINRLDNISIPIPIPIHLFVPLDSCIILQTIPRTFSNSYFPPTRTKVLLRNLAGKAWEAVCFYHIRRHYISGGWIGFARDNSLKLGDTCIFELVQRNVLQVHVFLFHH